MRAKKQTSYFDSQGPTMTAFAHIVEDLQKAIGPNAEVVLHDLKNLQDGVVAASGNVTGRDVGVPANDLLLRLLRTRKTDANLINYRTLAPDGRNFRSSVVFIRNPQGRAVGCLCLNFDITHTVALKGLLENELGVEPSEDAVDKTSDQNIEDTLQKRIDDAICSSTWASAFFLFGQADEKLTRRDRVRLVKILDDRGIFLMKKAVPAVARKLCISRSTLYDYIKQAKNEE